MRFVFANKIKNLHAALCAVVPLVLFLAVTSGTKVFAAIITSAATGNWSVGTTWVGGVVPGPGDDVNIVGHTVTVDANGECASLTVGASGGTPTLNIGAFTLTVSGNVVLNGTRNVIVRMTSSSSVLTIGGNLTLGPNIGSRTFTLDMSNGVNNASTLNIAGSMTRNIDGIFTPGTASTVNYNGTAAQTINLTQFTYANLTTNNTDVVTGATLDAAVTTTNVTGNISVNSGLFRTDNLAMTMANSRTLIVALGATMDAGTTSILMGTTATVTINGNFITANTAGFSGTAATAIRSTNTPTITLGANSTIEYNAAAAQTATNRTDYANVTLTGGSKTIGTAASQTITLSGNLTINSGATYLGSAYNPVLNIGGNFSNSGTFTQGSGLVTFNGGAAQTIEGTSATTFSNNVTLDNAAGLSITTSPTINGALTFTNGIITTGANKVIIGSAGSMSRTSGHVNGNLEIFIPNAVAPSRTFVVGDATNYTPVLIAFTGTTSGSGSLIASTSAGDDADIDNSGINSSLSVNRTWTVTQGAVPVGGFTSYSGTFTFIGGSPVDLDAGATWGNFVVRKFEGVTWATTTTGTKTATSTQSTGMTTFGKYQIGEARTITVATNPANSTICAGSNTSFSSTSTSIPAPTIQWQRGNPGYTNISGGLDAPNTTYSDFTTSTLTLTGSETPINGYLYRTVFTNINGTVTSTAAALTVNASPAITTQPSNQTVCISVNANFTVATSAGSPTYQWQMSPDNSTWVNVANGTPAGVTYTNATTATLTANGTSSVSLYYYLCVVTAGGCSRNSNSATLSINAAVPAAAGTITGSASVCQNQAGVAYSVGAISGATSYTWVYSGTGFSIASGAGTRSITADFSASATSGNLTVRGVNGCGNGTFSPNFAITVLSSLPAAAGTITGTSAVCAGESYIYSVAPIAGASSYTWAYSGTGMIISGSTASVTGTFIAGATAGNLTVRGTNACGSGPVSPNFAISFAVCTPHNQCNGCHIFHGAPGGAITAVGGNANLCISCHNPAGFASAKPFDNTMKAVPGVSGNSHSWDKPSVNITYETVITTNSEMLMRLPGDSIICSTCHNQHTSAPASPFLRASNAGNAMCKDCHSARDVGRYSDNPAVNKGSHPVGLVYPNPDSRFNNPPVGSVITVGGNVECTSCHKQHYAATSDGYILRQTNNAVLCTGCHTYTSHQGQDCKVCHQPHNTNKSNIYMIRNSIQIPDLTWKTVVFTAETGANSFADGDATYDGVCEVCHTATPNSTHINTGPAGDHSHNAGKKCVDCHKHNANSTSFTGCSVACHNALPEHTTNAHNKHARGGLYNFPCSTCHFNYGMGGSSEPTHPSGTENVVFDPSGLARRNGLDANTPAYNSGTKVCTNIYCHSNGYTAHRGSGTYGATLYEWDAAIAGSVTYVATPNWATGTFTGCRGSCHGGPVSFPPSPYTVNSSSPAAQLVNSLATDVPSTDNHDHSMLSNDQCSGTTWPGSNVAQCFWCHNTNGVACNSATNYQGTYGTSFHVDGQTHFIPFKIDGSGTTGNIGTFAIFNNRANDIPSTGHCAAPGGGRTCW